MRRWVWDWSYSNETLDPEYIFCTQLTDILTNIEEKEMIVWKILLWNVLLTLKIYLSIINNRRFYYFMQIVKWFTIFMNRHSNSRFKLVCYLKFRKYTNTIFVFLRNYFPIFKTRYRMFNCKKKLLFISTCHRLNLKLEITLEIKIEWIEKNLNLNIKIGLIRLEETWYISCMLLYTTVNWNNIFHSSCF